MRPIQGKRTTKPIQEDACSLLDAGKLGVEIPLVIIPLQSWRPKHPRQLLSTHSLRPRHP